MTKVEFMRFIRGVLVLFSLSVSVSHAKVVHFECSGTSVDGGTSTKEISVDLSAGTLQVGDNIYPDSSTVISPSVVKADYFETFDFVGLTLEKTYQISREDLSYIEVSSATNSEGTSRTQYDGKCNIVEKKQAF